MCVNEKKGRIVEMRRGRVKEEGSRREMKEDWKRISICLHATREVLTVVLQGVSLPFVSQVC